MRNVLLRITIMMLIASVGADRSYGSEMIAQPYNHFAALQDALSLPDKGLPGDFDFMTGYTEHRLGDNLYVAYIAMPLDGEGVDTVQRVAAKREGFVRDFAEPMGACTCNSSGGSPALAFNSYSPNNNPVFFEYRVIPKARVVTIHSAELYLYCCGSYGSMNFALTCYDGFVGTGGGMGEDYLEGCDSGRPACSVTSPAPTWSKAGTQDFIWISSGTTGWLSWDVTTAVTEWASQAPTTGHLLLFATGGAFLSARFTSSCNPDFPQRRPHVKVIYSRN